MQRCLDHLFTFPRLTSVHETPVFPVLPTVSPVPDGISVELETGGDNRLDVTGFSRVVMKFSTSLSFPSPAPGSGTPHTRRMPRPIGRMQRYDGYRSIIGYGQHRIDKSGEYRCPPEFGGFILSLRFEFFNCIAAWGPSPGDFLSLFVFSLSA
jgi:hypothetical protein